MPNDKKNLKDAENQNGKSTSEMDLLEIEKNSTQDAGAEELEMTADIDKIEQKMSAATKQVEHKNSKSASDGRRKKADHGEKQEAQTRSRWGLVWKIFGCLLGVVVLAVVIYGIRVLLAYNGFLDKVTGGDPESKEYSVVVLPDSNTNEIHELERHSVGYLKTDPKAGNAEQYLQSVVKHDASYYDDLGTLAQVLGSKISDAIVIESDWVQALKDGEVSEGQVNNDADANKKALENARVIYTFSIELDSEDVEVSGKDITKEPFVVLISGTDSRAGVKATARSDVNIVAVVNPAEEKILLVSIPRDTYVQLHGTTGLKDKLTHAGVYGINMSKQTIEDLLGIKIDDTVKVSFDTVVKTVDQLDGITIDSDQEMTLKAGGKDKTCHYVKGKQQVDGDCALRFARERKSYTTGDRHRGENQQQVITAIIDKLAHSKGYVLKLPTILDIAADSFESSLSKDEVASLIRMQLVDNPNWKVESIAIDGTGTMLPTYSMGANWPLYVMIPSDETITNAQNKINEYLSN